MKAREYDFMVYEDEQATSISPKNREAARHKISLLPISHKKDGVFQRANIYDTAGPAVFKFSRNKQKNQITNAATKSTGITILSNPSNTIGFKLTRKSSISKYTKPAAFIFDRQTERK